jgi:predicted ATPase
MSGPLPTGTVTFLFTDVEGSTKLLHELGAEAYAEALAEHRRVIREAVAAHGGFEVDTQGDAFFVAFPTAPGALAAALAARDALSIRVRMGLHSGTPLVTEEGYVGPDVHRAARIAAAGHGGQILVSASTAALVDEPLHDLGPHRLKDLSAPERIYQLGDDDFPPLKSLHQTNLPVPATPFVGRERELPEVLRLLSRDDVRLLTLTGPGGTGKTRLAAQAAGMLADRYSDGVWWVPLAPLRDSELVLATASQTLGAKNGVAEHIGDRSMLLLFDNFEQVVGAATEVAQLRTSCPNLDLLVTSREPLHVTGEQEYPVPPLVHEEGVGLFLARARAITPDFEPDDSVAEICRRLDDLPLALELAAARVKALTTRQILERLEQRLPLLTGGARDLPERQRTLRATIEWSYQLLNQEEQRLFRQLGVFSGGCTFEAAEQVAGASLDALESLIDKSLLRQRDERYWMLETIREFAAEQLEEETRRRHAEHFLALAEEAEPHLTGDPGEWLRRLEAEHDNLRAALDWFQQRSDADGAQRLTGALFPFWYQRGHFAEGRRRVEEALLLDDARTAARGKALLCATVMAVSTDNLDAAQERLDEASDLNRELGNEWGMAYARYMTGMIASSRGRFADAQPIFEESMRRFIELGDTHYELIARRALAWMCEELGEYDRFVELYEENLVRARETGNKRLEARSLAVLAEMAGERDGRFADAAALFERMHRLDVETGSVAEIAFDLCRVAKGLAFAGEARTAAMLLAKGEQMRAEISAVYQSWQVKMVDEALAGIRKRLDDAEVEDASREGRELTPDAAVALGIEVLKRA